MIPPGPANWIANIFQKEDEHCRRTLSTPYWDTCERGYMGALTQKVAQHLSYAPIPYGFKVSSRDTRNYDMFFMVTYNGYIKLAICEAKLVRLVRTYAQFNTKPLVNANSWDKCSAGLSHFYKQVRDNPWPNDVAYCYLFATELPDNILVGPHGFMPSGSTCFWREDVEQYHRTVAQGHRWNAYDISQIRNKISLRTFILDFLECRKGSKFSIPDAGVLTIEGIRDGVPINIPIPMDGLTDAYFYSVERFLVKQNLSSFQFMDFDLLNAENNYG